MQRRMPCRSHNGAPAPASGIVAPKKSPQQGVRSCIYPTGMLCIPINIVTNNIIYQLIVVQTAPTVRVGLSEEFGLAPGAMSDGQMVAALRRLGFDAVYDTNYSADLTAVEEAAELIARVKAGGPFPMFTSCCPAWVNLVEQTYPELVPHLSSCKSPQQMLGTVVKTIMARKLGRTPKDIIVVSIMPCVAKKEEASRPEFRRPSGSEAHPETTVPDVDYVLTTRELGYLLRLEKIVAPALEPDSFDNPLGSGTGGAMVFGVTGGVMEAALRTATVLLTGKPLGRVEYHEVRGLAGVREATIDVAGIPVKVAIAHGGANVRALSERVLAVPKEQPPPFHFIEMMACPGGCIGGGGEPKSEDPDILAKRAAAVYSRDQRNVLRVPTDNTDVQRLYAEHLGGAPSSSVCHELLHTGYADKSDIAIRLAIREGRLPPPHAAHDSPHHAK
jgi:NADP-reducing hydrogenase subunit HndD